MKIHILAGAIGALAILWAQPASAQYVTEQLAVEHADLDLGSAAGANVLLRRIRSAAEEVCGYDRNDRYLRSRREARGCVRRAMSQAVASTDNDNVRLQFASFGTGRAPRTISVDQARATARVYYADLNLTSAEGRQAFEERVDQSASQVCGDRSTYTYTARQRCIADLQTQARAQVDQVLAERAQVLAASASTPATEAATPNVGPALAALPPEAQTGWGVCAPRTHQIRFGGGAGALARTERASLWNEVDSASVCEMDRVVISADQNDALSMRRARATAAALASRGVPVALISFENAPGMREPEVRLSFAGVARAGSPEQAPAAIQAVS